AWATSLTTGVPLEGVDVALADASGETLWTGKTDAEGVVRAPGMQKHSGEPRAIVATTSQGDAALLDLADWDTNFEPYRFGLPYAWGETATGLRGYVFTERGVYRAGETVHVKGFVRV